MAILGDFGGCAGRYLAAAAVLFGAALAGAQEPPAENPANPAAAGGFRRFAPGVERSIDPETRKEETFSWHDMMGLLKLDPQYGYRDKVYPRNLAKGVKIPHDVWGLQFNYRPIRFIQVDLPDSAGNVQQKTIWYLVYSVRNNGDKPVRFSPRFLLHTHESDQYYPDRLLATAKQPIQRREDPRRGLLNSVEISDQEILPSTETEDNSVWGLATWRDIDPAADRFSIYVQGLTNAYKIETDQDGNWKRYARKTLQLNFWRPGDEFYEHEGEIRLGIPGDVDYRWLYK
jgi:hypothetical protein